MLHVHRLLLLTFGKAVSGHDLSSSARCRRFASFGEASGEYRLHETTARRDCWVSHERRGPNARYARSFRGQGRTMGRTRNTRLEAAVQEVGQPQERLAARFRAVAEENGARELSNTNQSSIARWMAGTRPSGRAPSILAETLTRCLGRSVTLADIGLATDERDTPQPPEWSVDTLATLVNLGGTDMDIDRRRVLVGSAYSVAGLALPSEAWWEEAAERARARKALSTHTVTAQDVESVREMAAFFSRRDQQRGGRGVGRTALVAYLRTEIADYLNNRFPSEEVRRAMTSAAGELAYLAGWTAFDAGEHPVALRWFTVATQLAEEARDAPLAGHVLRAMAHQ